MAGIVLDDGVVENDYGYILKVGYSQVVFVYVCDRKGIVCGGM